MSDRASNIILTDENDLQINPATKESIENLQWFQIPKYDEMIVDESVVDTITITYKYEASIVATKNVNIIGWVTTITLT